MRLDYQEMWYKLRHWAGEDTIRAEQTDQKATRTKMQEIEAEMMEKGEEPNLLETFREGIQLLREAGVKGFGSSAKKEEKDEVGA